MPKGRFIVHIDMDAFFAAIEQRDNPLYRGKPVVVGADPKKGKGRGVVSTCSYEARRYGIHSAMPISIAYQKCPRAVFLPVNMEKYSRVSSQVYKILYDFTPDVELVSIDEAFLDITGSYRLFGTPNQACLIMKTRIKKELGLTASAGLAPTKMAAKIASDLKKPDGFVEVTKEGLLDFLWALDVGRIWGLGKKSETILKQRGVRTIGDLAKKDKDELVELFGANGEHYWRLANGIDESEVETEYDAKSISNETTFEKDTRNPAEVEGAIMRLSEKVSSRLREDGLRAKTITLKIRLKGFRTYTRSVTVAEPTNFVDILARESKRLYAKEFKGKFIRLVGVKASNLSSVHSRESLFADSDDSKTERVHAAVDKIRNKFGDEVIHRAGSNL